jgi:membrane-associated phospholipid phosphatase
LKTLTKLASQNAQFANTPKKRKSSLSTNAKTLLGVVFFFFLTPIVGTPDVNANPLGPAIDSVIKIDSSCSTPWLPATNRRLEPGIFDMITNLPSDWRDWYIQTAKVSNWPVMALVTASTAVMIVYDNQMWVPFKKLYDANPTVHTLSDDFVFMGDGKFQFGVAGIFAGYGLIAGDKRALRTASQTCEVILAAGGVVQLLKHLTGRESPVVTTTPTGRWQFFPNQITYANNVPHYDAFPSGHLATALATVTVIANNYPEQAWIRPVGYAACAGIVLGLVSTSIHWWSDYPLAIALGYGFGSLLSPNPNEDVSVTDPPKKTDVGQSAIEQLLDQATIMPTYQAGGIGVAMTMRF